MEAGEDLVTTSWDILGGTVQVAKNVLLYDDNGAHPAMTVAEFIAESSAELEVVTPNRTLAPDIGATSYPGYFRALNKAGAAITLNLRLERVERRGNKLAVTFFNEYAKEFMEREVDQIVVENGTKPLDDLYFSLKPMSKNGGEVDCKALLAIKPQEVVREPDAGFQFFRIGDAIASRNIHAAILDAHRFMAPV